MSLQLNEKCPACGGAQRVIAIDHAALEFVCLGLTHGRRRHDLPPALGYVETDDELRARVAYVAGDSAELLRASGDRLDSIADRYRLTRRKQSAEDTQPIRRASADRLDQYLGEFK